MQRMHMHKPDWHTMGIHLGHVVHDPRFWAGLALAVLLGLMILATIFTQSTNGTTTMPNTYPGYPYLP